jgi:uncharacterized membrane protein
MSDDATARSTRTNRQRVASTAVIVLCALSAACGNTLGSGKKTASFRPLTGLPGESVAYAVSADGRTVTGVASDAAVAFRWDATTGMTSLGALPGFVSAAGLGVSVDGLAIVGSSGPQNAGEPFVWTARTGMVALNGLSGGNGVGSASAVSADGTMIAGWTLGADQGAKAVVWNRDGEPTEIAPDAIASYAVAMNPTRVVVAGNSFDDTASEPFRWQPGRGLTLLGDVGNGTGHTVANAISTDGRVICGQSILATGLRTACCWRADRGWTILPTPAGTESNALGVNLDGSIVVGAVDGEAAIWNRSGLHYVAASLEELGIELPGGTWQLWSANGVTPDGQTIVGSAIAPDGLETAWIAVVPAKRS